MLVSNMNCGKTVSDGASSVLLCIAYLFDHRVCISSFISTAIFWKAIFIQIEGKGQTFKRESSILEPLSPEFLGQKLQKEDVFRDIGRAMTRIGNNLAELLSINDSLSVGISKLSNRSVKLFQCID